MNVKLGLLLYLGLLELFGRTQLSLLLSYVKPVKPKSGGVMMHICQVFLPIHCGGEILLTSLQKCAIKMGYPSVQSHGSIANMHATREAEGYSEML